MLSKLKNKVKFIIQSTHICILIIISIFLNINFSFSNEDLCSLKKPNSNINETAKIELGSDINCIEKRVIDVLIIYDENIILNNVLKNNIENRFQEVNEFYTFNYKIEWKITNYQKFKFNKSIDNLSSLFSLHKDDISQLTNNIKAEVVLALIERDIKGIGIAATFSNVAMVADSSSFNNYINSVVIAHEFAHLFGAWHTQRKKDFMLFSGANNLSASRESNAILKLMRDYNFDPKTIINEDTILNRISRLYKRHHAKGEIDPVARLLTDAGNSLYQEKIYNESIKLLIKSNKYYGRWGKTRMILSKNYYELDMLQDSFTEYTRAIFFGSKPDKKHENKLKKKFIDLQKNDPSIKNPFELNN